MTRDLPPVDKARLATQFRGIYSALLLLEAFVVLLVPAAVAKFGPGLTWPRIVGIALVVLALVALCAFIKKPWAIKAGWVLQFCVVALGIWVWAMYILGAVFAGLWYFAGNLYRDLQKRPDPPPVE